jgi:hypothetical protein
MSSSSSSSTVSHGPPPPPNKTLSVSVKVAHDTISRGNEQTVFVNVSDKRNSSKPVSGAHVKGITSMRQVRHFIHLIVLLIVMET